MAFWNGFFPLLASEASTREFVAELTGPRWADWVALHEQIGTTHEIWTMQQTPMGIFMVVLIESDDIEKTFGGLAADNSEFGTWYKAQLLERTGVDFDAPPQGPQPEVMLHWSR